MSSSNLEFTSQVNKQVIFLNEIYSYKQGDSTDAAFTQWLLGLLFPTIDSDQAFNSLVGNEIDGISAYYKDDEDGKLYLIRAVYSESQDEKFGPGIAYNLLDFHSKILMLSRELRKKSDSSYLQTSKVNDETIQNFTNSPLIDYLVNVVDDGYSLISILAVFGDMSSPIDSIRESYSLDKESVHYFNFQKLKMLSAGFDDKRKEFSVSFEFTSSPVNYNGIVDAIVGNISAFNFSNALERHSEYIYEANLRVPLGGSQKVNKQIEATLDNEPELFWYYNNGITILCSDYIMDSDQIFTIISPTIVNGAQTANSVLSSNLSEDSTAVLLVKIIKALPSLDKSSEDSLDDLYMNIAKFTNSQNPIQPPDFKSNEKVHKSLHSKFKEIGWFYEHRRGQWNKADKTVFDKDKRITMADLAQVWYAFDGNPAIAIRKRLSLFDDQGHYGSIFMPHRSAEEYLVAYLIFKQIENKIKQKQKDAKEREKELVAIDASIPRDVRNYLIIGSAAKLTTAHMSAILKRALTEKYGFFNKSLAETIMPIVESGQLIERIYVDLEEAIERLILQIIGGKNKTLIKVLSEEETLEVVYGEFEHIKEREQGKGREILDFDLT